MKLSIIIPTLNEAENLRQLLPFLYENAGSQAKLEVLVVDAIRTNDDTEEVVAAYNAQLITCNQCSRAAQMNLGASRAKGEVLYFLHADTRPALNYYQYILHEIGEQGMDWGFFSYQFDSNKWWLKINAYFTRFDGVFAGGGDQSLFVKRRLFEQVEGFDEHFVIMEDFDLVKRLREHSSNYRVTTENVTVSARKYQNNNYFKVNLVNLIVFVMYWMGLPQTTMRNFYSRSLRK